MTKSLTKKQLEMAFVNKGVIKCQMKEVYGNLYSNLNIDPVTQKHVWQDGEAEAIDVYIVGLKEVDGIEYLYYVLRQRTYSVLSYETCFYRTELRHAIARFSDFEMITKEEFAPKRKSISMRLRRMGYMPFFNDFMELLNLPSGLVTKKTIDFNLMREEVMAGKTYLANHAASQLRDYRWNDGTRHLFAEHIVGFKMINHIEYVILVTWRKDVHTSKAWSIRVETCESFFSTHLSVREVEDKYLVAGLKSSKAYLTTVAEAKYVFKRYNVKLSKEQINENKELLNEVCQNIIRRNEKRSDNDMIKAELQAIEDNKEDIIEA